MFKHDDPEIKAAFLFYDNILMEKSGVMNREDTLKIKSEDLVRMVREARLMMINMIEEIRWRQISFAPKGKWLITKRVGEKGINLCMLGEDGEWFEHGSGRTTVTHSTFASPTHYYRME